MEPINMDKLKENAVRVEEVDGKIKLDKQNKADVEWYEEEYIMYRFLLFSYGDYYPCGGMRDLELKFNNFSELVENKDDLYLSDYIEIYDIKYDNVIYISDKRLLLKEFIDYLKKEE